LGEMSNFSPVNFEYTLPTFLESTVPTLVQFSLNNSNSNPSSRRESESESQLEKNELSSRRESETDCCLTNTMESESSQIKKDSTESMMESDENMKKIVHDIVDGRLGQLYGLWTELGLNQENKKERNQTIQTYFVDLLDRMVEEEFRSKKKILDSLESNTKRAFKLSAELGIPFTEPDSSLVLIYYEKAVRNEAMRLSQIKEDRMKEVIALKRDDEELCKRLCMDPFYISTSAVPTTEKFEGLKDHIAGLETEKFTRLEKFFVLKENILSLYEDLESEPVTEFEREVVCEDADIFVLSSSNMSDVANILTELEERLKVNKKIVMDAVEKLDNLYERLQLDMNDKFQFLNEFRGNAPSNIRKLHLEVARLEEIKKANIGKFINTLREELHSVWDECFYTLEQRNDFKPLHSIEFTEELLEQHEDEVKRLKTYIILNRDLLTKVGQRHEVWGKYIELERRAKDPSRLMNNRGNQLLMEEKERNKVNKMLPKLEYELKDLISSWEDQNQTEFLVGGVSFTHYCEQQKNDHIMQIEAEKQAREQNKKKTLHQESMFGAKPVSKWSINSTGTPKQPPRTPLSRQISQASRTPLNIHTRRLAGQGVASPVNSIRSPHAGVKGGRIAKGKSPGAGIKRTPKTTPAKLQEKKLQAIRGILEECSNESIITTRAAKRRSVASEVPDYADFKKGTPLNSTVKGTPEPSRNSRFATPKVPSSKGFGTPKGSSARMNMHF